MKFNNLVKTATAVVGLTLAQAASSANVDEGLVDYQVASGVSGNLSSIGSDTLANLMTLWAEEFKRAYPNVNIQIQGAGSSTAPRTRWSTHGRANTCASCTKKPGWKSPSN